MTTSTNNQILLNAESFVREYLPEHLDEKLVYHNLVHTEEVVEAVKLIGEQSGLSSEELQTVLLAAWFHDIGFTQTYHGHEEESVKIAAGFLMDQGVAKETIDQVEGCILATKMGAEPQNKLEAVLKDADLYHLATSESPEKGVKLRKEWAKYLDKSFTEEEWLTSNIEFYANQQFYTDYGKEELQPKKEENLKKILNSLANLVPTKPTENGGGKKKKKKKNKSLAKADRGIETVFRTTSRNHINLSAIADRKANIMISVNSIIISIVVTFISRQIYEYPHLIWPTLIILGVSLTTIIFAILAVRPQITKGTFTDEDVLSKRTNLLFFGNFFNMDLENYEWGMREMMNDSDYIYGSLIRDVYFLGKVLAKKYKMLRIAYNVFMFGLIISVLAFAFTILAYQEHFFF